MVAVLSKSGIRLMPTSNYKARRLLKSKRAKIYQYRPFTIQLTDRKDGNVQPVELNKPQNWFYSESPSLIEDTVAE